MFLPEGGGGKTVACAAVAAMTGASADRVLFPDSSGNIQPDVSEIERKGHHAKGAGYPREHGEMPLRGLPIISRYGRVLLRSRQEQFGDQEARMCVR